MAIASREPVNAFLFVEPELSKQIAFARRGILNPSVETLSNHRYVHLYRLGHSSLPDEENLSSPWWSDFQSYVALKNFAETNSISLTISSRVSNAQTPEFGAADVLYSVALAAPLMVLQGLGRPVMAVDGRIFSPPHAVTQTFVPGLRAWPDKIRSAIWQNAFCSYTKQPVAKGMISLYGE